jgi:hypothetical protein
MTITVSFALSTDAGAYSHNANYATMSAGSSLTTSGATTFITWGQGWNAPFASEYTCDQAFFEFAYTKDSTALLDSAYFELTSAGALSAAQSRDMQVREYDWGGSIDTADWRTAAQFAALTILATCPGIETAASGDHQRAGGSGLINRLDTTGNLRVVVCSDRFANQSTPSTDERSNIRSADYSGTADDPMLVYTTTPLNLLNRTMGAQVQLSDGTHIVLETSAAEGTLSAGNIKLRRVNSTGTATDIATLSISGSGTNFATMRGGPQSYALAADASDNLYVISRAAGTNYFMCVQAFVKGGGLTWTAGSRMTAALSSYDAALDQWVATWHSVGGTKGTLMVIATGVPGSDNGYHSAAAQIALVNCDSVLASSGTVLRGTANFSDIFVERGDGHSFWQNETLTGLDVCAAPGSTRVGYAISYNGDDGRAFNDPTTSRYKLNSSGTGFTSSAVQSDEWTLTTVVRDANSKLRAIPVDSTRFATAGGAYPFRVLQVASDSSAQTDLGECSLATLTAASKPSAIYNTQTWDVVYDSGGNRLWFYYIDASRRLIRSSFNLSTYLPNNDETVVSAAVGAVGSTNYAIRCARGALITSNVLITIANKTSGGVHSVIYQMDNFNVAPNAPTLTPKANFDATTAGTFAWTFSDPNASDTQSAFEIDINTAAGVDVYDSGEQSGTITYVAAGTAATGNNASVVPGLPAGIAEGDCMIMLASIRSSGTGTVTTPTGWTALATSGNMSIFGRIYRSGDTAPTVAFAGGAAGDDTIAQIAAWRGTAQDITAILDAAAATQLNGSAQNVAYPAYTVTGTNRAVIVAGWKQDDSTGYATLAGMTEIGETNPTAGNDASQAWDYVIQTTAVNVTAGSFTVTGGAAAISRGIVLALKPAPSPTASSFTLPANILTNGNSYQWRVRTWDAAGLVGAWSGYGTFSVAAGGTVTVTDPASDNPAGIISGSYTVHWSVAGTTQQDFRVIVIRTDTSATISDSGWITSVATSYAVTGLLSGVEQQFQVTVRNAGLIVSATGTRLITPNFSHPETPTLVVTTMPDDGYTLITVTNPAPTGDKPEVTGNQILRRLADSADDYLIIGTAVHNGSYRDYAAASGTEYEYVVRGVATTGNTDSAAVTATLTLLGVWLHDPSDPQGSAYQYPYGRAMRTADVDTMGQGTYYAGREFPVVDFGEYTAATCQVKVQVPNGDTWAADMASLEAFNLLRRTLCFRDNRGRRMFATLSGYDEQDEEWGTTVTFIATSADYTEAVA